jgi:hypothetical protein
MRPEEASIGLTPAREANAASDRHRPGVRPGDDEVGGADRTDAGFGEQGGHGRVDEFAELAFVGADLFVQQPNALGQTA